MPHASQCFFQEARFTQAATALDQDNTAGPPFAVHGLLDPFHLLHPADEIVRPAGSR
ncbi:MAG: hypothetical protein L0332_29805 [Chloroflexi bacterium]|nr:hypothetical protein [Chloroflexota bacterium]MCI0730896.1 hypothetical protein [Chloroflexota bacterium]